MTTSFALLGSTTLGSGGTNIAVTIASKKYLIIEVCTIGDSASAYTNLRFNADTGNNYSYRVSFNGGVDSTTTSTSSIRLGDSSTTSTMHFCRIFVVNISTQEKLIIGHDINQAGGAGAGNIGNRTESVGKWANTSNAITEVDIFSAGGQNFGTGSIVTVYGSD